MTEAAPAVVPSSVPQVLRRLPRVLAILDASVWDSQWAARLEQFLALVGGLPHALRVDALWVCVRGKDRPATELAEMTGRALRQCRPARVPVLLHGDAKLAASVGADGVHLSEAMHAHGAEPMAAAMPGHPLREWLVAASCHSATSAVRLARAGIPCVVLGPVFDTPSKRAYGPPLGTTVLAEAARAWPNAGGPTAIGGIETGQHVRQLIDCGVRSVAAIRALWSDGGEQRLESWLAMLADAQPKSAVTVREQP